MEVEAMQLEESYEPHYEYREYGAGEFGGEEYGAAEYGGAEYGGDYQAFECGREEEVESVEDFSEGVITGNDRCI